MITLVDEPNVVMELKFGNTKVKIADNYCRDKTEEEVEEILERIARIAQRAFNAAAFREQLKNSKRGDLLC